MSALLDPRERRERGLQIQSEVLGQAPPEALTPVAESWRDFVFAEVWSRPGLERRARYLIAIAGAAIGGNDAQAVEGYVHGALKSGTLSLLELREVALHLGPYGNWSKANLVDQAVSRAVQALGMAEEASEPLRAEPWDPDVRDAEGRQEFADTMTFPGGPPATPFLQAINNFVFGEMWRRRALDQRSRRWLTLVGVCDSASEIPIKSHVHAAMASGNCTSDELLEFVLAYGVHAGWPKASMIQGIVLDMAKKVDAGLPWHG